MNIQLIINYPTTMPKSLDLTKLIPITSFSIINIKWQTLTYLISPSPYNQHQCTLEKNSMLISTFRNILLISTSIRSLYPIPSSISMSPQPPSIIQCRRVLCSSSKCNHHSISSPTITQSTRMICPSLRTLLTCI